jgi:peptidoglycan/LPS O-acetylase OafA/YrhL
MRLIGIDMLRGIAVTLVIFRHSDFVEILSRFGWAGVDLFFVLSGFLVSGLLFKEYQKFGSIKPGLFLIRRGFKIYPLFYALIAITSLKALLVSVFNIQGNENFCLKTVLSELFFVQNYFDRIWSHTWSLAVEEHFYLLLTIIIYLLIKNGKLEQKRLFNLLSIGIFVLCLMLRIYNGIKSDFTYDSHLFPSHFRFDSLFFGVFISYHYCFNKIKFLDFYKTNRLIFLLLAFVFVVPGFIWTIEELFMNTLGLSFLYIGFGFILIEVFLNEKSFKNSNIFITPFIKLFSFIGYYSYSIYLWHIPVKIYMVIPFINYYNIELSNPIRFLLYFGLSVVTGYFTSRIIEIPLLNFREQRFKKRLI